MKIKRNSLELEAFVQAILCNKLEVGEVVRQSELCQVLGISMSPLRELLVLLEELELVEVKPRAGFKVIYPDINFMRENMQFRVMIEKHALEAFIETVSDKWITEQTKLHREALKALETAEDSTEHNDYIVDLDREFHRTIVGSLENTSISKAHEYTQTKLRIARRVHRRIPPRKVNIGAMTEHLEILKTLKTRNLIDVSRALDAHFSGSLHNTLVGY